MGSLLAPFGDRLHDDIFESIFELSDPIFVDDENSQYKWHIGQENVAVSSTAKRAGQTS